MPNTLSDSILRSMKSSAPGKVFTNKDFRGLGSRDGIDQALSRLVKEQAVRRIGRGLYDLRRIHPELNLEMSPDMHQVAVAVARRLGWQITPSGALAANLLRLTTQVPAQYVYLTNGQSKTLSIGKQTLVFKRSAAKDLAGIGRRSGAVIQAIKYLGKTGIDERVIDTLRDNLSDPERKQLLRDASHVTDWIVDVIHKIAQSESRYGRG
jgi:hypothetical protein